MEFALVSLYSMECENGEHVGMFSTKDTFKWLYYNEDKGLLYTENNRTYNFLDMLDEHNYKIVIDKILEMQYSATPKVSFKVSI